MKLRFTIGRKLGLGFGILMLAILLNSVLTFFTLNNSRNYSEKINNIYNPSVLVASELSLLVQETKSLIYNWVFIQSTNEAPDKIRLRNIYSQNFPAIQKKIKTLSAEWNKEEVLLLDDIFSQIDTLFFYHQNVITSLYSYDAYYQSSVVANAQALIEQNGIITAQTDKVLVKINQLTDMLKQNMDSVIGQMIKSFESFSNIIVVMAIFLIIAGFIIAMITIRNITNPVNKLKRVLLIMGKGKLPEEKIKASNDEIGEMSRALNILIDGLKQTATFANHIGKGNLQEQYTPLSEEDELGNALLEMRSSLQNAQNEELKRKSEDEKRSWATQGLAKFADILRYNNDNVEVLSYNIIQNLVSYINANIGGLFIINDDNSEDPFLELMGCFAYDRMKYMHKKIHIGEGLVGACFQEQQTIYLTDIPDNYVKITSGLGERKPKSILIVPLKVNDVIYGVIELGSLKEFMPHEIDFVEKIGESIASTISSVKINIKTATLLEQSQQQAEAMRAQEEEMRQNMEELNATQEEMARKESEMRRQYEAITMASAIIETDLNGRILRINERFCEILSVKEKEILGQNITMFFGINTFDAALNKVQSYSTHDCDTMIATKTNETKYLHAVFSPLLDRDGTVIKVVIVAEDATALVLKKSRQIQEGSNVNVSGISEHEIHEIDEAQNE